MLATKLKKNVNNKNHNQPIYSENTSSGSDSSSDSEVITTSTPKQNKSSGSKKKMTKKKKSLKDEFKMDIKDMIVKKRLASLNASAIMSASYAQERPKDALGKN